jgi:hypothetical protein
VPLSAPKRSTRVLNSFRVEPVRPEELVVGTASRNGKAKVLTMGVSPDQIFVRKRRDAVLAALCATMAWGPLMRKKISRETARGLPWYVGLWGTLIGASVPARRTALAAWITDPRNPLTARVAVNHIWTRHMGTPLVQSVFDFGRAGAEPTHPQLLDYLASDFRENGWDLKRLVRQIVTSSVYRQSSAAIPDTIAEDPENRLLARGGRYRLSAEMIRDQALAVSGLLVDKVGGPPVKPYELELAFKPLTPDEGEGLYRRSLYTFWQRNGPAPALLTMDSAKRDVCQVKRERTSSPLQALILLNGTQYVESAKWLAYRVDKEVIDQGGDEHKTLARIFRTMTSRQPTEKEQVVLVELYQQQHEIFRASPQKASDYLNNGAAKLPELQDPIWLAALTSVANALMNFDATVTRR